MSSSGDRGSFETLCRELNIDLQTRNAAWQILERLPSKENTADQQSYWRACALYVAGSGSMQRMLHGGDGRGAAFSLVALLRACDIRLVDFFEPLKSFVAFLALGAQYEEQLKALEKQFVVSAILFQKYEACFAHLLRVAADASLPAETERRRLFSFGWDLFLVAKCKLLPPPVDLIDAFHVLLCVVDTLLVHAPDRLRAVSLDRIAHVVAELATPAAGADDRFPPSPTLAYLCAHYRAPYHDVRQVQVQLVDPLLVALRQGILRHQPARLPPHAALSHALYMGGLLDAFLAENAAAVQREYQLSQAGGIGVSFDERLFVDRPEQLGSPTRVSAPTVNYYVASGAGAGAGGGVRVANASPARALASMQPQAPPTPISAAQTTIQWLVQTVTSVADGSGAPPSLLSVLVAAQVPDAAAQLAQVHAQLATLVGEFAVQPKSRATFVRKLFYRQLEAMLRAEHERLAPVGRAGDVAALLQNDHFRRSLLACCFEIVVVAHKMPQTFPYAARKLGLVAIDMYKIIEHVMRCEPTMPSAIVRHLVGVEESVLEAAAWSAGSPIWRQLLDAPLSRAVVRELCNWSSVPGHAAFSGYAANLTFVDSDDSAGAAAPPPQALLVFYRKVLQLVAMRSFALTRNLNLPVDVFQEMWSAQVHALTTQPVLQALLCDRHVDLVIMCTVYGVCKVQSRPLTFRAIIDAYRRTVPGASSAVYRDVPLPNNEHGDIIAYYNTVFIPAMERPLIDLHARVLATAAQMFDRRVLPHDVGSPAVPSAAAAQLPPEVSTQSPARRDDTSSSSQAPRGGAKLLLSPQSPPQGKVIMSPFRSTITNTSFESSLVPDGVTLSLGSQSSHHAEGLREINESISPRVRRAPKRLFDESM
jgi:hypothetical protein